MAGTASADAHLDRVELTPTYVVIGGQRCATTWIHRCLDEHPEVFATAKKELHFFNDHYDQGIEWYLNHFRREPGYKAWGEVTPAYLSDPETPQRMSTLVPNVRLVCSLRNPVERAYSIYQLKRYSEMPYGTFEDALDAVPDILERGLYAKHLKRWHEHFDREQLLVLFYDDLERDDLRFVRAIYRHLGVDEDVRPSLIGRTANAVIAPRVRNALTRLGLGPAIKLIGRSQAGAMIRRWHRHSGRAGYRRMDEATARRLHEFYEQPNRELEALLGADLSHWRKSP